MIDWDAMSKDDSKLSHAIAQRAGRELGCGVMDTDMNITACHVSGCELRLAELLEADAFNFAHDVDGIGNHIDKATGKLRDCFRPRYAK